MYLPSHFAETRLDVLGEAMRRHPFGLLITSGAGGLAANGLPFIHDAAEAGPLGVLRAHVARANPVWREAAEGAEVLVVFQGPQGYVSPGWYPSKAEHGKVVPTWNYVMVQAHGHLRIVDDADWLRQFVSRLTDRHEAPRAAPWGIDDAPADFIATQLRAIVGIEIEVTALTGKWKVSQNRPAADRAGVVEALAALPGDDAARLRAQVAAPGSAD